MTTKRAAPRARKWQTEGERQAARHTGAERVYREKVAAIDDELDRLRRGLSQEMLSELAERDCLRRELGVGREVAQEDPQPVSRRAVYRELRAAARLVVSGGG